MYKIEASVVIPTYNRSKQLKEALGKFLKQDFPSNKYELVIVDDGSTDDTKKVVEKIKKTSKVHINYFHQKNQGQGIARNYGIKHAKGNIIIFSQDDIFVPKDFINGHVSMHRRHKNPNEAVLGFIAWDPRMEVTPLMEWLTNGSSIFGKFGGHQFAFEKLNGKDMANFNFFYTSNISLKRALLIKFPFDTRFSKYGWEDIELGYRLTKKAGLKIYYDSKIIAYHYHEISLKSFKKRMEGIGYSAHLIHKKYPELKKIPSFGKQLIFDIISNQFSLGIAKFFHERISGPCTTFYFYALSKKHFLKGLREFKA